jgi:hypothetical protein
MALGYKKTYTTANKQVTPLQEEMRAASTSSSRRGRHRRPKPCPWRQRSGRSGGRQVGPYFSSGSAPTRWRDRIGRGGRRRCRGRRSPWRRGIVLSVENGGRMNRAGGGRTEENGCEVFTASGKRGSTGIFLQLPANRPHKPYITSNIR